MFCFVFSFFFFWKRGEGGGGGRERDGVDFIMKKKTTTEPALSGFWFFKTILRLDCPREGVINIEFRSFLVR